MIRCEWVYQYFHQYLHCTDKNYQSNITVINLIVGSRNIIIN